MIADFLSYLLSGEKTEGLCQLEQWRAKLLGKIHEERSCIALLDEMLCNLKKAAE